MTVDEAIQFCKDKQENIKLRTEPETFLHIQEMLEDFKAIRSLVDSSAFTEGYKAALNIYKTCMQRSLKYCRGHEEMFGQMLISDGAQQTIEKLKELQNDKL